MPRGCLVKEGKCFEGIIIFDVGQQIILSHNRAIANILYVVLTTGMIHYSQEDLVVIKFTDQGPSIRKGSKVRGFSRGLLILFYHKG